MDSEVAALRAAYTSLSPLDPLARGRAMTWLSQKLEAERREGERAAMAVAASARRIHRITRTGAPHG